MRKELVLIIASSACPRKIKEAQEEVRRCEREYENAKTNTITVSEALGIFLIEVNKKKKSA
jgi:hypothetical protein